MGITLKKTKFGAKDLAKRFRQSFKDRGITKRTAVVSPIQSKAVKVRTTEDLLKKAKKAGFKFVVITKNK